MAAIALVQSHPMAGRGIETRERAFACALGRNGHQVTIWTLTRGTPGEATIDTGGKVIHARHFRVDDGNLPSSKQTSHELVEALKLARPDAILFKGLGYQIVTDTLRAIDGEGANGIEFGAILGGRAYSSQNTRLSCFFVEYESQIQALRAAYDKHDAWFRCMPKLLKWPKRDCSPLPKAFDVCSVGAFNQSKNQRALLPLLGKCSMALVGDGPLRAELQGAAAGHADATFTGPVSSVGVADIMRRSRLQVHPSRYEGLPRVAVEGFWCGLPLVALRSTLGDALGGLDFVTLVEEEELERVVLELLGDDARLQAMSKAAREYARREHSRARLFDIAREFGDRLNAGSQERR